MLRELVKIANKLDNLGLNKEADTIDNLISKIAYNDWTGSEASSAKKERESQFGKELAKELES